MGRRAVGGTNGAILANQGFPPAARDTPGSVGGRTHWGGGGGGGIFNLEHPATGRPLISYVVSACKRRKVPNTRLEAHSP